MRTSPSADEARSYRVGIVQEEPERAGALVELAGDRCHAGADLAEGAAVLVDDVGQGGEQPRAVLAELLREVVDAVGDRGELLRHVGEARRRLARQHVPGCGDRCARRAQREGDEALAAEGAEVEARDRVASDVQLAIDGQRHAHLVAVDAHAGDAPRLEAGQADLRAGIESLDVGEIGIQRGTASEESDPQRQLDGRHQQDEAHHEEDSDALLARQHALLLIVRSVRRPRRAGTLV